MRAKGPRCQRRRAAPPAALQTPPPPPRGVPSAAQPPREFYRCGPRFRRAAMACDRPPPRPQVFSGSAGKARPAQADPPFPVLQAAFLAELNVFERSPFTVLPAAFLIQRHRLLLSLPRFSPKGAVSQPSFSPNDTVFHLPAKFLAQRHRFPPPPPPQRFSPNGTRLRAFPHTSRRRSSCPAFRRGGETRVAPRQRLALRPGRRRVAQSRARTRARACVPAQLAAPLNYTHARALAHALAHARAAGGDPQLRARTRIPRSWWCPSSPPSSATSTPPSPSTSRRAGP